MSSNYVFIPHKKQGFSHPKCYLGKTKDCCEKISKEHYISENLLNKIERVNTTIDVVGLSWLPSEHLKSIGKSSLTSNILCVRHNSALSGLDSQIGEFVEAICSIDNEFLKDKPKALEYYICGDDIERWILKTLIGLVESKQIKQESGLPFLYKSKCLDLLCDPNILWPMYWGLYLFPTTDKIYHSTSFELIPKSNPSNGEILALSLKINGLEMNFLMGRPDNPMQLGVHRPRSLIFVKGEIKSVIFFNWKSMKKNRLDLTYTHSGTYTGKAPGFNLPRAD